MDGLSVEELQPNIDGLSFDEVLLIGLVPGVASVLLTGAVVRHRNARVPRHQPTVLPH